MAVSSSRYLFLLIVEHNPMNSNGFSPIVSSMSQKREKTMKKHRSCCNLLETGGGGFPHLIWKHKGAKSKTRRRVYRANHDPLSCLCNSTVIYNMMRGWEYGGGIQYLPFSKYKVYVPLSDSQLIHEHPTECSM